MGLRVSMMAAGMVALFAALPPARAQQTAQLSIDTGNYAHAVSPTLYGMMTEEINHAFDGGLYAELLMNRTFREDWMGIQHWDLVRHGNAVASYGLDKADGPSAALHTSVKVVVSDPGAGAGLLNAGFWGIPVKPNTVYQGSLYAKTSDALGPMRAQLINDATGAVLAETSFTLTAGGWTQYHYTLKTAAVTPSTNNHLELTVAKAGTFRMQLASLMPPTYHGTANGNRIDLMEKMAGLHPKFLRLPGGNYLEGDHLRDWYNWKQTVGPLSDRPGHQAPWTYWSTDGMGLLEFLEWCEDLKIEPLLAVYAGYSLQQEHIAPGPDLQPYVQSALDEVEYVTGDTSTKWGAQRARDGHPAPFPLHYIEIGNEDWFDKSQSYDGRFAQFALALRAKYPQYKLIATTPVKETDPNAQPDVLDDHYYKASGDMLDFTTHYDNAPRTGPKIFVGEWATLSGQPTPDWGGALADAAWMTSMERNSDLIIMASYAPLFTNVNAGASQWWTNMIGYDALHSYGSPSYYAQALFGGHLGDQVAKSSLSGANARFYDSATVDTTSHVLHLKLVNANDRPQALNVSLTNVTGKRTASVTTLHAATFQATNTLDKPDTIFPVISSVKVDAGSWQHTVPPLTIEVIDVPLQ